MRPRIFLAALLGAVLSSCSADLPEELAGCDATEALLVGQNSGSTAHATFLVRREGSAAGQGSWRRVFSCRAYIGRNGTGKTAEGDGKTPLGIFRATGAFGVLPCPGGRLPYLELTPSTFACDEPGEYYNKIIDTSAVRHSCRGEDMYNTVPAYNYGLTVDFNPECVYPAGSNIFVHCFSGRTYTAGCIALPERRMRRLLRLAGPGTVVFVAE